MIEIAFKAFCIIRNLERSFFISILALEVIFNMGLAKLSLALLLISITACSQQKSDTLFVFVGKAISIDSGAIDRKGFIKLKYKILEKTYGNFHPDTIEFSAYYDADSLKFTRYQTVLLFLHQKGDTFSKLAFPWYHVYQTVDGRWASGAKWWEYGHMYPTTIKPRQLQFKDSVYFDLDGMSQEQIDHWYPTKYYQVKGVKARPIFGNYADELFEIQKNGFLKDAKFF